MTTELTSYSLSTTAYVQLVALPEYSSFPPTFWDSQNLYVNQRFCKCNLSRVERGKRGEEVFMTVINLPPGQRHDNGKDVNSVEEGMDSVWLTILEWPEEDCLIPLSLSLSLSPSHPLSVSLDFLSLALYLILLLTLSLSPSFSFYPSLFPPLSIALSFALSLICPP